MGKQPDRFEERRQLIARVIQQRVNYRPDCPIAKFHTGTALCLEAPHTRKL